MKKKYCTCIHVDENITKKQLYLIIKKRDTINDFDHVDAFAFFTFAISNKYKYFYSTHKTTENNLGSSIKRVMNEKNIL